MLQAAAQGLTDLGRLVGELQGAVYVSYEVALDSVYLEKGNLVVELYSKDCKEAKGKGVNLGSAKHYLMIGLYWAYQDDKNTTATDKLIWTDLIGKIV